MQKKLSDICHISNGFFLPKAKAPHKGSGIPYIGSADMQSKKVDTSTISIPKEIIDVEKIKVLAKGALLIALSGPSTGQVSLLDTDAVIDQTVCAVTNNWMQLDNKYLYYFLLTHISSLINTSKRGIRINSLHLRKLKIVLAPLTQQQVMVKQIEDQLKRVDSFMQRFETAKSNLQQKKKEVLDLLIKEAAKHKEAKRIPIIHLAKLQSGLTPTQSMSDYYGDEYSFFKPSDIEQGTDMKHSKIRLSARGFKVARPITAGSVLIACNRSMLGKVGITTVEAACNMQMLALMPFENVQPLFLYYQIQTENIQQQIRQYALIDDALTKAKFEHTEFIFLPVAEQLLLIRTIEESLQSIDDEIAQLQIQLDKAKATKKDILQNSFKRI